MLLRREGQDKEVQNGAWTGFRTLKSLNVVKDLYGVLAYVDKVNKSEGYPVWTVLWETIEHIQR